MLLSGTGACPLVMQRRYACIYINIYLTISRQKLKDMIAYIMQHAYVQLGDQVCRHIKGIPMGFHVSPDWTNLYLTSLTKKKKINYYHQ